MIKIEAGKFNFNGSFTLFVGVGVGGTKPDIIIAPFMANVPSEGKTYVPSELDIERIIKKRSACNINVALG